MKNTYSSLSVRSVKRKSSSLSPASTLRRIETLVSTSGTPSPSRKGSAVARSTMSRLSPLPSTSKADGSPRSSKRSKHEHQPSERADINVTLDDGSSVPQSRGAMADYDGRRRQSYATLLPTNPESASSSSSALSERARVPVPSLSCFNVFSHTRRNYIVPSPKLHTHASYNWSSQHTLSNPQALSTVQRASSTVPTLSPARFPPHGPSSKSSALRPRQHRDSAALDAGTATQSMTGPTSPQSHAPDSS